MKHFIIMCLKWITNLLICIALLLFMQAATSCLIELEARCKTLPFFCCVLIFLCLLYILSVQWLFPKIKCDKIKIGKKYRISFKEGNKTVRVCALITANDIKKKLLKFETKEKFYDGKWNEFKIQSLTVFRLKIFLCCFIPLLLFFLALDYSYNEYRNPANHICPFFTDEACEKTTWECDGWKCECKYENCYGIM